MVINSVMQIVADNYLERLAFEMESRVMQIEQCSLVTFHEIFPSLLAANPFDLLDYSKFGRLALHLRVLYHFHSNWKKAKYE